MRPFTLHKKDQFGLTLLEVIVSLAILSAATIGLASLASRYSDDTLTIVTASQIRTFGQASNAYIKENYAAIQAVATPTAPALINVGTLITAGKLPAGYSAVDAKGHNLCTLVIQPTAARLQAMVVGEGGTPVNDLDLGALASTIGGSGGGVYSSAATVIRGAVGGWLVQTITFDNLVNNVGTNCAGVAANVRVVTGTPVMALWFENGDTNAAFLARDPVPGRPELNVMNAALVLDSVQTAGAVCTRLGSLGRDSTGALLACQAGLWRTQGSSFWQDAVPNFASLPTCNAANSGQTRVVTTPTVGTGPRAYNCNGTAWLALAVDNNGNILIPGIASTGKVQLIDVVTIGAACSPAGLVSRDATGIALSCQSGVWRTSTTSGQYAFFNSPVCPLGWLAANGTNGTVDLRGEFIRAWDNGKGADPARGLATWQSNELQTHNHGLDSRIINNNAATFGPVDIVAGGGGSGYGLTSSVGGSETRPRNVALLACMQQ